MDKRKFIDIYAVLICHTIRRIEARENYERESKTTFRGSRRVQRQETRDPNHILVPKSLDPTQH